jgi:hypothetical protein
MTVICARCGASNILEPGANRNELLCGNCYGPLDEAEAERIAANAAEIEKLTPLKRAQSDEA